MASSPLPPPLNRRSSYDPHSTKTKLSLGSLPPPSFRDLGAGQRSVPAVESSRHLGGFRAVSSPFGDGLRTPGGSLVVGSEVFGFGRAAALAAKEGKDRWGDGLTGEGESEDPPTPSGVPKDSPSSDWPSAFEKASYAATDFQLAQDALGKNKALNGDFAMSLNSRPHLKTTGSSLDLRSSAGDAPIRAPSRPTATRSKSGLPLSSPSTLNQNDPPTPPPPASIAQAIAVTEDTPSPPPSLLQTNQANLVAAQYSYAQLQQAYGGLGGAGGSSALSNDPYNNNSNTAAPLSQQHQLHHQVYASPYATYDPTESAYFPSNYPSPYVRHARLPPNQGFGNGSTAGGGGGYESGAGTVGNGFGPNPITSGGSPDDLSFGMQNLSMNGGTGGSIGRGGVSNGGGGGGGRAGGSFSPGPYGREQAPSGPTRQGSGGQQAYAAPSPYYAPSPYLSHQGLDPYAAAAAAAAAAAYGQEAGGAGYFGVPEQGSRESIHQQPWGLPLASDYSPSQLTNNNNSRHGSFSYSPALPGSNGGYAAPGSYAQQQGSDPSSGTVTPIFQPAQQHQIILGRGLRSNAEYIAPGPINGMGGGGGGGYGGGVGVGGGGGGGGGGAYGYGGGFGAAESMGRALRSATLEEFRNSRHRNWELVDLLGHVVEFAGDQLGSRHIQTKLETASTEDKALVFEEILPNMLQLSTDVFANYVIQKFFEQGSQLQKTAMANVLEGHVLQLSLQMYGCRVVQKALEYVLVDQQVRLIKELDGHVLKCARDAQSNHVVQRALERVPSDKLLFITEACLGHVHSLATHPYGCRVLQRIFENCPPTQTRALLDELHTFTQNLIQDQYGNYVIQWVIEKGSTPDRSLVISKIYNQVLPLAQQKFASNVIEKCVIYGTDEERSRIVDEVLATASDGTSVVKSMLVHPFANYVMQKILQTAKGPQREALFSETAVQLANLRKFSTSYSKHLIAIEKLLATERAHTGYPA